MAKAIVVYSYTGKGRAYAKKLAEEENAVLAVAEDEKRPGTLKAYTLGCFAAMKHKSWPIMPMDIDLHEYNDIVLIGPIWAGNPAPEYNSIIKLLPKEKTVFVRMISASGGSSCKEAVEAMLQKQGCTMADFQDIKA